MELKRYQEATREAWLAKVALGMVPKFKSVGAPLPRVRVTMSLIKKGRAIGLCYDPTNSADGTTEIMVRIDLFDAMQVAAILAHELIHAAVGCKEGHKGAFKRVAIAIGLEGKMTATVAGPKFVAWVQGILESVGPFPHAALNFNGLKSGPKKQTARMIKVTCPECEYVARTTRFHLDRIGAPLCPCNSLPMHSEVVGDDDEGEERGDE